MWLCYIHKVCHGAEDLGVPRVNRVQSVRSVYDVLRYLAWREGDDVILFKARCQRAAGRDKYNTLRCAVDFNMFGIAEV